MMQELHVTASDNSPAETQKQFTDQLIQKQTEHNKQRLPRVGQFSKKHILTLQLGLPPHQKT